MKKVTGILIGLAVLAGLGAAGYYLFGASVGSAEEMTIGETGDVETETICNVYLPVIVYDPESEDEAYGKESARESYEEGNELFDLLEGNEGAFFFVDSDEEPEDDGWPMVVTNKEKIVEATDYSSLDSIMTSIGVGVEGFLNQDAEGMKEWDACKRRKGMFPSGLGYDLRQAEPGMIFSFNGESPDKYFKDRELSIKCEDISAEKVAVFKQNDGFMDLFIIYDARVRTESCKGESYFPPEGETKDMRIMVGATWGSNSVIGYNSIYFR